MGSIFGNPIIIFFFVLIWSCAKHIFATLSPNKYEHVRNLPKHTFHYLHLPLPELRNGLYFVIFTQCVFTYAFKNLNT